MASSSITSDLNIEVISKMKVAEIKKELKSRGLSTAGAKTELVERLKAVASESAQDLVSEDGNAESEILDEDEDFGGVEEGGEFDDDDLTTDAVLADELKIKPLPVPVSAALKRPAPTSTELSQVGLPKKRTLVRPTSLSSEKENGSHDKSSETVIEEGKTVSDGKKVIKLSGVTLKDRLELRAQKFGASLSEAAKKEARAERFGSSYTDPSKPTTVLAGKKIVLQGPSEEMLKKRAERFGSNVSSFAMKIEEQEKLKKRQERFGVSAATVESLEEKKKLRAERFKLK